MSVFLEDSNYQRVCYCTCILRQFIDIKMTFLSDPLCFGKETYWHLSLEINSYDGSNWYSIMFTVLERLYDHYYFGCSNNNTLKLTLPFLWIKRMFCP